MPSTTTATAPTQWLRFKTKSGVDASKILGGLLINSVGLAAYSRADIAEESRVPFKLYADEFQNFTTLSLVNMASELRKYKVGMTLAHQYREQLDIEIARAAIGNVGTLIAFRLGANDALYYEKEFAPVLSSQDLLNVANYIMYLKPMIGGKPSRGFSGETVCKNVGCYN